MDNDLGMSTTIFSAYLTWSDDDEARGVYCTDIGPRRRTAREPLSAFHRRTSQRVPTSGERGACSASYQLVYISPGEGDIPVRRDGVARRGRHGDRDLPRRPTRLPSGPFDGLGGILGRLRGSSVDRLLASGFHVPGHPLIAVGLEPSILSIFDDIFRTVKVQEPFYQIRAGALVLLLLAEIHKLESKSKQQSGTRAARRARQRKFLMSENIDGTIDLDGMSDRLGVGKARFYESFKSYTGMTPYQYFIHLKINRAKDCSAPRVCPSRRRPSASASTMPIISRDSSGRRRGCRPRRGEGGENPRRKADQSNPARCRDRMPAREAVQFHKNRFIYSYIG